MTLEIIIFGSIIIILLCALIYLLLRPRKTLQDDTLNLITQWMKSTREDIDVIRKEMQGSLLKSSENLHSQLAQTHRIMGERLDNASKVLSEVSKEIGRMQEMGRSMKDLQEFLVSPKFRGSIGEQVLRDLLEQYFPSGHFEMQYKFKEGDMVDAILKTDKGIIPIDSKFPMENFQRFISEEKEEDKNFSLREFKKDVKRHIDKISKKYILPEEGTVDFAVMYVPSETVYYEIIKDSEDISSYAYNKKVFTVSPNSFYYFLKVILMGMEGRKIEEAAKEILKMLRAVKVDSDKFAQTLSTLNYHITNAKVTMDKVNNDYIRLSSKIDQVRLLK